MATRLMTEDELDFNVDSLFPFGESTQSLPTGSPEWFKNYIYSGGLNDAEATKRGIEWVVSQGMRPQDAVNLWNKALGTSFNVSDLFSRTGSGPEFTNFGQEGSWQTGANAVNDAQTGMIRSADSYFQRGNEAVVSDELFWNPNSPTGAALAAKIQNARQQGQRPGIVITPYAVFQGKATNEQLLNEVKNSGADFVALDPYLGWGVSADDLFEWTKNFIPQLNALGKEVKLVTQGFARKGEEEAVKAYNDRLLSLTGISEVVNFGLEDWFPEGSEEAKQLFSASSEWTPLDNDYKPPEKKTVEGTGTTIGEPATPAAIEPQATMRTPQSAANVGEPVRTQQFSGLFGSGDVLANKAQEVLAASGRANDPRFADAIVGSFTQNGVIYNVQGDGSIQGFIETPTGAYLAAGFTPSGKQATEQLSTQFEQTSTDRLLGTLANAAIAAGTAAGLGPAGVGFLSTPAAAAAGAGSTTFFNTGDLQQALKAAALGGATAFGIEQLFPTAIQTAANTAVDLAGTGASQTEIVNALVDQGVRAGTAAQIAGDALAGATARQIATDFAGASIGGTAAGATSLAPNVVEVLGSTAAPGLLATAAPSLAGAAGGLLGTQSFPVSSQTVQVQAPQGQQITADQASAIVSAVVGQPVSVAGQQVQVSAPSQQISADTAANIIAAATGQQVMVQGQTAATTQPTAQTGAAGGMLAQTVPVQATSIPATQQITAPAAAATGGLLGVPVQPTPVQTTAPSLLSDTQSVTVQGATTPAQVQATAPAAAAVGAIAPSQAVQAQAPAQQVQVQAPTAAQDITADVASAVLSNLIGQPVSVAGSTQQVEVTGQAPAQQVAPEVAAALISAATGQQVTVAGQTISPQTTPETVGAATGGLLSDTMQTVPVQSTTLPAETQISAPAGAAVGGLLSDIVQTVPVTGQTMATTPAVPETVGSVIGSLVPTQTVPVTGQTITTQPEVPSTVGAAIGSIVPTQTVPVTSSPLVTTPEDPSVIGSVVGSLVPSQSVAVTGTTEQTPVVPREVVGSLIPTVVPPPAQQVTVESRPIVEDEFTPILTPPPVLPPKFEVPIPEVKVAEPTKPLVSTNDLLKLLTLLGTGTAGTGMMGGGTTVGSIPPSDTMLGSTTPQFGPDYYAAIQRYYNAYMPAYPRNVAGPLQQWYENKYGA